MSNLRQAAQQALEALENAGEAVYAYGGIAAVGSLNTAAQALRAALAEPEQPVAWMYPHQLKEVSEYGRGGLGVRAYSGPSSPNLVPVYTAPTPNTLEESNGKD